MSTLASIVFYKFNFTQEIDVKAGGGHVMTIGEMLHQWLTKLEWYSTLFPRIPVPIQKQIDEKLKAHDAEIRKNRALGGGDNKQVEHEENSGKGGSDHRHEDRRRARFVVISLFLKSVK